MTLQDEIIQRVRQIEDPAMLNAILSYTKALNSDDESTSLTHTQKQLIDQRLHTYKTDPSVKVDAFEHLKSMFEERGWNY